MNFDSPEPGQMHAIIRQSSIETHRKYMFLLREPHTVADWKWNGLGEKI